MRTLTNPKKITTLKTEDLILTDSAEAQQYLRERETAQVIGQALVKYYPKRNWMVKANDPGQVAYIANADIATDYGMVVHTNCSIPELQKRAVMLAGELLERFSLSRSFDGASDILQLNKDRLGKTEGLKRGYA